MLADCALVLASRHVPLAGTRLRIHPQWFVHALRLRLRAGRRRRRRRVHRRGQPVRVVASEISAHVLLGAAIEPWTRSSLIGARRYPDLSLAQPITSSGMRLLAEKYSIPIPHPPRMNSKGNYIGA
ncbi:hypothetical protein K438DRAFT_1852634 [Mycena galopus ATCC 62051]|nr:hypothetical protein K438DRAFT_1852634 [Mycena galopus ATCC 62051]